MASNRESKGKGWFILLIIIILVLVLLFIFVGYQGLFAVIKWFFIIALILSVLGAVFYFVWFFFFKKQKFDVTYVNKQKLLEACQKGNTGLMKGLYVTGDKGHARVYWGKITGYCRISVLTKEKVLDESGEPKKEKNEDTHKEEFVYQVKSEEQDVFSVSHRSFPMSLFEDEDIVRVKPDSHDELVGDVNLKGFSLLNHAEYWFLNNDYLDINIIDSAILDEAKRGIAFEILKDTKEIVDKASGLDTGHQKKIEERSMYEIPATK